MKHYETWRDLLATLLTKPKERKRLAQALGVSVPMLQRWAAGAASPQPEQQERLLQALPQYAMLLRALLAEEFNDLATHTMHERALVAFSAHIFALQASAPDESRYWSICTAILSEAVARLDPERLGLALRVLQCMAPSASGQINALRESASLGTPPWPAQIEFHTSFFGSESLAGQAVASGLPRMVARSQSEPSPTGEVADPALSSLALPILHSGQIAGCLLAESTQATYFAGPGILELLQNYTALLALAFSPEHFYPLELIALEPMPSLQIQRPYLSGLQQRVLATLKTAFAGQRALNYLEAQQYVWSQIAEELLQLQGTP